MVEDGASKYDIAIVGAGVIGLTAAISLRQAGAEVLVCDVSSRTPASVRNAGLIVPSYSEPVPSRGDIAHFLQSTISRTGTVGMSLAAIPSQLRWLVKATRIAFDSRSYERRAELLIRLSNQSLGSLERLIVSRQLSVGWERHGSLQVFRTTPSLERGRQHASRMRRVGIESSLLDPAEAREREPLLGGHVAGAIHFSGDASVDPVLLAGSLREAATADGVHFTAAAQCHLTLHAGRVRGMTLGSRVVTAERFVIAAGAWTGELLRKVGIRFPVVPGKGYALDIAPERRLRLPLILNESHVVVTPMPDRVRLTTGLQLVGFDSSISTRIRTHFESAVAYDMPELHVPTSGVLSHGFRPLSPDGVPIIGPLRSLPEIIVASGHGVLGVTLAAITAEKVTQMCEGARGDSEDELLSPRRFGL